MITLQVTALAGTALAGTALGLMALDEKDNRTLIALQVTPLPLRHYMTYRVGLPMAFSFLTSLLNVVLLHSFLPYPDWGGMALVAILEFLPLTKALGLFIILPVIAYFVPEPWLPTGLPRLIGHGR